MRIPLWLLSGLAAALAGCASQPPAVPPEGGVPVPAGWSTAVPEEGPATVDGWAAFGDPLLSQLVRSARQSNTDVTTAQARLAQARALRRAAAAALLPTLSGSASAKRSGGAGAGDGNVFSAGLDATWDPDVSGANGHALRAAEADEQSSAATLAATELSVAAEAALDYLQLRGAQARLAIAQNNLQLQQQTLQITQWRAQAGLASSIELAQARTAVAQTRATVPALQASVAQFEHALAVLTGQPPAALQSTLEPATALPRAPAGAALAIPARVLRQRPEVRAAELQLLAAGHRVAEADAARRPTLDVRATLAWSGLTLGSVGSVEAARSLVAALTQPLFDGGLRNAQLASQQAAFGVAQQAYRASVLAALQDVEDALAALQSSRGRVAALSDAAEAARNAALLATQRHASGLVDFQVVLETQRTLLSTQDSLASAQTDELTSHVRLYKAMGGGWSDGS